MKYLMTLIISLNLISCATPLHRKVLNEIQQGEPKDEVIALLGDPDGFSQTKGNISSLMFVHGKDRCEITLESDIVISKKCDRNPNYVAPIHCFTNAGYTNCY